MSGSRKSLEVFSQEESPHSSTSSQSTSSSSSGAISYNIIETGRETQMKVPFYQNAQNLTEYELYQLYRNTTKIKNQQEKLHVVDSLQQENHNLKLALREAEKGWKEAILFAREMQQHLKDKEENVKELNFQIDTLKDQLSNAPKLRSFSSGSDLSLNSQQQQQHHHHQQQQQQQQQQQDTISLDSQNQSSAKIYLLESELQLYRREIQKQHDSQREFHQTLNSLLIDLSLNHSTLLSSFQSLLASESFKSSSSLRKGFQELTMKSIHNQRRDTGEVTLEQAISTDLSNYIDNIKAFTSWCQPFHSHLTSLSYSTENSFSSTLAPPLTPPPPPLPLPLPTLPPPPLPSAVLDHNPRSSFSSTSAPHLEQNNEESGSVEKDSLEHEPHLQDEPPPPPPPRSPLPRLHLDHSQELNQMNLEEYIEERIRSEIGHLHDQIRSLSSSQHRPGRTPLGEEKPRERSVSPPKLKKSRSPERGTTISSPTSPNKRQLLSYSEMFTTQQQRSSQSLSTSIKNPKKSSSESPPKRVSLQVSEGTTTAQKRQPAPSVSSRSARSSRSSSPKRSLSPKLRASQSQSHSEIFPSSHCKSFESTPLSATTTRLFAPGVHGASQRTRAIGSFQELGKTGIPRTLLILSD